MSEYSDPTPEPPTLATRTHSYRNGGLSNTTNTTPPIATSTTTPVVTNDTTPVATSTTTPVATATTTTPIAEASYLPELPTTGSSGDSPPRETATLSSISTMTSPTLREQPDPPSSVRDVVSIEDVSTEVFTNGAPGEDVVRNSATLPEQRRNKSVVVMSTSRRKVMIVTCITAVFVVGLMIGLVVAVLVAADILWPSTVKESGSPSSAPTQDVGSSTLSRILERGSLVCAVVDQVGYSTINSDTGEREGFDIDLARAVSAGIFGSGDNVTFVTTTHSDRFTTLTNSPDVDVMIAASTHTMERDLLEPTTGLGFTFSTPYLYNGIGFAGVPEFVNCAEQSDITESCSNLKICVLDNTTHLGPITELFSLVRILAVPTMGASYEALIDGDCTTLVGEQIEISEAAVRSAGYTGEYVVGTKIFSNEPLAIVTRDDDARFSDFVNWILRGLLAAEEQGVTQATASTFIQSRVFGAEFENMFVDAVADVGNYGEIYARHLEPLVPRKPMDMINDGTTGLIYSFPFGNIDRERVSRTGPDPSAGGTLEEIIERGHLVCGVTSRPGFAEFDSATETWSGLDIDYCRALSASVFSCVVAETVVYKDLSAEEGFIALARKEIDVLSSHTHINMVTDVFDADAMTGFSFSLPIFYDGLGFRGLPQYVQCADELNTTSPECQDMCICVDVSTTSGVASRLFEIFPDEPCILAKASDESAWQAIADGDCQVVAESRVTSGSGQSWGNSMEGEYELGVKRFTKEPLALVTRQDDPRWTSFVFWIVSATFHAEEEGISKGSSNEMPTTDLFPTSDDRTLRNAIQIVGSYQEIYERNLGRTVPRGGMNLLNSNPFGPQHCPYPFI